MTMKMKKPGRMSPIFEFSISQLSYMAIFMKIFGKKVLIHFFVTFLTNPGKNENEDEKIWKNESDFWILHVKIRLCGNFHENVRKKFFDPFFKTFLTNRGKNKTEDEQIWENESDFSILHIKIRLCGNFHENLREKFLTHFLTHFWLIEAKMKMKIKKFGKMSPISEFFISKLGCMELSIKIWEKSSENLTNVYLRRTY